MSRDPHGWYPLHFEDPVPGEPTALRDAGHEYRRVAEQIARSAEELRAIAGGFDQRSVAVDEVTSKAARLADQIERAHGRYAATGTALLGYADVLSRAQELSLRAREQAQRAVAAQESAQEDIWFYQRREQEVAGEPELARVFATQLANARASLLRADQELEGARVLLASAQAMRDDGADAARAAIRAVLRADDLHDTVWQDLGGGVQELGLAVWEALDEVATVLGVLALVLCWLPGVNVALAALATIAGAVVLVRDVVDLATGNGSWADVGWSALGVITFGVGRVATKGLRMATEASATARGVRGVGNVTDEAAIARATRGGAEGSGAPVGSHAKPPALPMTTGDILRSSELWSTLKPSAITGDLQADLRVGAAVFRPPAPTRPSAGRRQESSVNDVGPVREHLTAVGDRWSQSRFAGLLELRGHQDVARDMGFLARHGELSGSGWAHWRGAVDVSEVVTVGRGVHEMASPMSAQLRGDRHGSPS